MLLGKITVLIEFKNKKWIRCRPIANGKNEPFRAIPGRAQVVYIENCSLSQTMLKNNIYTLHGIFHSKVTNEDFNDSLCKVNVSPLSETVFNQLISIYPQENHAFSLI